MTVMKKLDIFWLHANCSPRRKLIVADAVLRSKLMYGLDSLQLNKSTIKQLETFQLKIFRKNLREETTFQGDFIDHSKGNAYIYRRVKECIADPIICEYCLECPSMTREIAKECKCKTSKSVPKLSEIYVDSKIKLMAKISNTGQEDPRRRAVFARDEVRSHEVGKRRCGRPRERWTETTLEELWGKIKKESADLSVRYAGVLNVENERHLQIIDNYVR